MIGFLCTSFLESFFLLILQPGVTPGEGWCFHGSAGSLVIAMADDIKFNSFSLEHISAKQSASGEILSAPRDIEVYVSRHRVSIIL